MTALNWNGLELEVTYDSDPGSWTEEPWEELEIDSASIEDFDEACAAFGMEGMEALIPGLAWDDDGEPVYPDGSPPCTVDPSTVDALLTDDQRRDLMELVR